ncbi:MAG: fumarylacetoacetate hydrolase family protein [Candidatus Helarchaeales archaeon]
MKLVQFIVSTPLGLQQRIGALLQDKIVDLYSAFVLYLTEETNETRPRELADLRISNSMNHFIEGGERSLEAARQALQHVESRLEEPDLTGPNQERIFFKSDEIKLTRPLTPKYFVDFLTFEKHFNQGMHKLADYSMWKKTPVGYKKNPGTVIGPNDDIVIPTRISKWLDFEVELATIIGRRGKNIPLEEAEKYIFGYTILNDFSARDIEIPEILLRLGPFKSKDFDTAGPMGPCIVTSDEIKGHPELEMELRVNGEIKQKGNTKEMIWTVMELVEYTSRDQTIVPGTVLCSGNPGKYGEEKTIRKSERLRPGDVVETKIEKIGVMRNKIVKE